jgi:hypothetical protein
MARAIQRAPKRKRLTRTTDTVVTSMVLPRTLHRRAVAMAYELNWSMAELTRQAVQEWLERHAAEFRTGGRS